MTRDTIVDRLFRNRRVRPEKPAMFQRRDGHWEAISWRAYVGRCEDFAGALLASGLQPGDAVPIQGDNCAQWLIADVGAMIARAVPTGIYQTSTAAQAAYIARHCDARIVVLENKGYYDRLVTQRPSLPRLQKIVMIRDASMIADPMVVAFEDFCLQGHGRHAEVEARAAAIGEGDLATLIYTSGTTGDPKAAMLSHRNLAHLAKVSVDVYEVTDADSSVSYLPLSHIAEQALSIHVPISAGAPIWFAGSTDKLKETLLAARPTMLVGVPRVWEKFHTALTNKLREATGAKAAIVGWSRKVGMLAGQARIETGTTTGLLAVKERIAERLFFSKLKKQLGLDRLRVAVTGAAPINREVLEFFLSCGIIIREVYGQTETTAVSTLCRPHPGQTRLGTVGKPLDGVQLKLAEDGEVLVMGPTVFLGYLKDVEQTKEMIVDGWLHSGDVGEFDADGFLRITDRKKDLFKTAGGKYVAPQNIEALLKTIDGIGQAVAIGDRRKYVTALLTVDPDKAKALIQQHGWPATQVELARHPGFRDHAQKSVDALNTRLARFEAVKRFTILDREFTLESGELTPTQKIKRKAVTEHYAKQIDAMYAEAEA